MQKVKHQCDAKQWFEEGESCEILKAGSLGWQKGKFKLKIDLSLEFISDRIEQDKSPLDDVRQEISENDVQ